ncbi:MAG: uracil-DNA glycosylase [Myxococcota bacterium]|jgi:DNA polymerase|nr:uracil-DNA glycosylase [Myxococcota bacterium]
MSSPLAQPDRLLPSTLEELRQRIGDCRLCALCEGRTNLVFGEGNPRAELVFVGEGPGRDEDLTGRPFVGEAGQLLDKIIAAMGLRREEVYICNIVKCRPPQNRVPLPDERSACRAFLEAQLRLIAPRIVVALGATATAALLGREEPLSRVRSTFFDYGKIKVMPTYHPAYLLRNPGEKRAVWEDIRKVMSALGLSLPHKTEVGSS